MSHSDTTFTPDDLLAHHDWVRTLARSLVRDEHAAADLEQDTWVRALEHPPRRAEGVRGWLATVLRNRRRDVHRSDTRRDARERAAARPEALDGPDEMAARADLQRRLIEHVLALEEPYRGTLLYRWFEGLGPAEIAARQGVPASTVRTRLARGLDALRARLDREAGGDGRAWRAALTPLLASSGTGAGADGTSSHGSARRVAVGLAAAALLVLAIVAVRGWGGGSGSDGAARPAGDVAAAPSDPGDAPTRRVRARSRSPEQPAPEATPDGAAADVADGAAAPGESPEKAPPADGPSAVVSVTDAEGRPAEGATVTLVDPFPQTKEPGVLQLATATTDAAGRVEFRVALPEAVGVLAQSGDSVAALRRDVASGSGAAGSGTLEITLRLERAVTVTGVVRSVAGRPLAKARLTLAAEEGLEGVRLGTTGADGRFRFDLVPRAVLTGKATVYARADGHTMGEAAVVDRGDLVIELNTALTLTGRCVDEDGEPAPDVNVTARGAYGNVFTASDGRFRVPDVPRGEITVDLEPDAHAPRRLIVTAPADGDLDLGDVVLARGGEIHGVVVDRDGVEVAGAQVQLECLAVEQYVGYTSSDEHGAFKFEHVGEGDHVVHAAAGDEHPRVAGAEGATEGVRAGARDVRVTLTSGNMLFIELLDAETGEPVVASKVELALHPIGSDADPVRTGYFGDDLRSVRARLEALGAYRVVVDVPGFETFEAARVELSPDRETKVRAKLVRKP